MLLSFMMISIHVPFIRWIHNHSMFSLILHSFIFDFCSSLSMIPYYFQRYMLIRKVCLFVLSNNNECREFDFQLYFPSHIHTRILIFNNWDTSFHILYYSVTIALPAHIHIWSVFYPWSVTNPCKGLSDSILLLSFKKNIKYGKY